MRYAGQAMIRRGRLATAMIGACVAALLTSLSLPAGAGAAGHVDGISDQSLPAWDDLFSTSPFAGSFRESWAGGAGAQIELARYVVQWNVMSEPSGGPAPVGDYRERFEAWLQDARSLGLVPVVALTSFDHVHPGSPREYRTALAAILDEATAMRYPIAYVEPWNEPNNQGAESAVTAAEYADSAAALCEGAHRCEVIAGDFEDGSKLPAYERAYEQALTFPARIWGVHPYVSLQAHEDSRLRRFKANLPGHGAAQEVWFTEIAALYCRHGELRGEAQQASDASYLLNSLIADPVVAPVHVFYYGFLFADRVQAPCTVTGGDDSELYAPTGAPRAAARVLLETGPAGRPPPSPPIAAFASAADRSISLAGHGGGGRETWNPALAGAVGLIEAFPSWNVEP
jgi:hypothetical protein